MAQPKKKKSSARRDQRRSQDTLNIGSIVPCSHCRRPHLSHHVCPNCGYYAGREVMPEEPPRRTE